MIYLHSPNLRERLIAHLRELSDLEYQKRYWKVIDEETGNYDEFDYSVHFLYDDTDLAYDPDSYIGCTLYSQEEAECVRKLATALDIVFEVNGLELDDHEYLSTKEWPLVLRAAAEALSVIEKKP
ncbi:SCO4402 family protein [Rhizobium herbae]|uniref:Uncharacterized protein n=1 Tax=Rhizobium herbae TaxID=508661 RepID=A0ABS4EMN5_9HYPH|nr:hypothetical protein [Rhizobium herbae]MBP1859086.1 hypothetical protein [Rhizobium herbae]